MNIACKIVFLRSSRVSDADNPIIGVLRKNGYQVFSCSAVSDGVEISQKQEADIVAICPSLGFLAGVDAVKYIRADKRTRSIPVLMAVDSADASDYSTAFSAGADDVIKIPSDEFDFISRVKLLIKLGYYRNKLNANDKFEAVFRQMQDGVAVCGADFSLKRANSSAEKQLNTAGIEGGNILDHLYANFDVSVSRDVVSDLSKHALSFEIVRKETRDTKALCLECGREAVTNLSGDATGVIFTFHDISGKKKEDALKQNFLSFISHKLKTPLTVLFARADLLKSGIYGELNAKQTAEVNSLLSETRKLRELFNRLISFIEHSHDQPDNINIKNYLTKFFRRFASSNSARRLNTDFEVDENLSVFISPRWLDDIFDNLADNAVKFNDNEAVLIKVAVSPSAGNYISFEFSDNGRGIPSEEYDKIFDKFYQVEKDFTGELEGVGIGLSHVKSVIERAQGSISVKSVLCKGTTFVFRLPAGKPSPAFNN